MTQFKIKKGLSENLLDSENNPLITLEEGCWYLTTDTAELYVAVLINEVLTLKKANDTAESFDELRTEVEELKTSVAAKATTQIVASVDNLPTTGEQNTVYFIEDKNKACIWNGTNYIYAAPDVPDYNEITTINGGTADEALEN